MAHQRAKRPRWPRRIDRLRRVRCLQKGNAELPLDDLGGKIWKDMAKRCGTWSHYIFEKNIIFGWWGSFRLIYTSIYTIQSMSCHVSNGILQPAVNERRALPMAASPSIWPDRIFVRFFSCQAMRKQTGLVGKGHLYGQHNSNTTITHTHTHYIYIYYIYVFNYYTYIYLIIFQKYN